MRTYLVEAFLLVAGLLLSIAHAQGLVTLQMLLVMSGIIIITLMLSLVPRWWPTDQSLGSWLRDIATRARLVFRYPDFKELEQVLANTVYADGKPMFYILDDEKGKIDSRLRAGRHGLLRQKPLLYVQIRVREHLSWVDALSWIMARRLKEIGFDVKIYIHDYDFLIKDEKIFFKRDREEYVGLVEKTREYVRDLCGSGIHIVYASTFFDKDTRARKLTDFIYREMVHLFVRRLWGVPGPEPDTRKVKYTLTDLLYELIGWIGAFAAHCLVLESETPLLSCLQWEERAEKWRWIRERYDDQALSLILVRTACDSEGNRVRTPEWADSLNLTDSISQLADKIIGRQLVSHVMDSYFLRAVCNSLLFDKERDFLWSAFLDGATPSEVKELIKRYFRKQIIDRQTFDAVTRVLAADDSGQSKVERLKQNGDLAEAYLVVRTLEGFDAFVGQFPYVRAERPPEGPGKDVLDIVGERYQKTWQAMEEEVHEVGRKAGRASAS